MAGYGTRDADNLRFRLLHVGLARAIVAVFAPTPTPTYAPHPCRAHFALAEPNKGEHVPLVMAYHDVDDVQHWLASPKREEVFGPLGVTNIRTFVDPQNPTHVAVLMDVADMDVLMVAMQSEPLAEAMAYDGVLPETLVILVEA
jgi:hypothetical protein